jgi:hypothetical protein
VLAAVLAGASAAVLAAALPAGASDAAVPPVVSPASAEPAGVSPDEPDCGPQATIVAPTAVNAERRRKSRRLNGCLCFTVTSS